MDSAASHVMPPADGRRVRFLRWLRSTALLSTIGTAAYFAWGAVEAGLFHARIDTLRSAGALPVLDDLRRPPGPPEENGYPLLRDAQKEAYTRTIELRVNAKRGGFEPGNRLAPYDTWSSAQLDHLREMLADMAPLTAKIDEALARPRIVAFAPPGKEPGASMEAVWVLHTCQQEAAVMPRMRAVQVDRMLRFMDRWRAQPGFETPRTTLWESIVLPELGTLLRDRDAAIDARFFDRWQAYLRDEEIRLLALPARLEAYERAVLHELLAGWQRGDDPMRERRESFGWLQGQLETAALEDEAAEVGDQVRDALQTLRDGLLKPPPHQAWWAWPLLQHTTRSLASELPDEPPQPWTLEDLRTAVGGGPARGVGADLRGHLALVLKRITLLRCARAALAVHAHLASRRGGPLDLEAVRAMVHIRDALQGMPLVVRLDGDFLTVQIPPSALRDTLGPSDHYAWRLPLR